MKSKNSLNATRSPAEQQALDLQLIEAVKDPRGERYESGLTRNISELLTRGADVNARDSDDATALMLAAKNGHTDIVSKLLDQKADVNAARSPGYTALILAAENGHTETVAELLARGADVNSARYAGLTALMLAAENGHTEVVAQLLDQGADVNAARSNGHTALMIAALNGHTEIFAKLLARGADVNAARFDGFTALMFAADKGHTEIVAELLARGANVNAAARSDGFTALMLAAQSGHAETVSALLSRDGIDWQIVQNQLNHPELQNLNKGVSFLLAVTLPGGEPRNSIITSFNQRNPDNAIQQENNDILGAGLEAYKNLKDLKSSHVRYLTDPDSGLGLSKDKVEISADQRFFYLLNHQDARQEALARNDLVTTLVSESASLAINSGFGDEDALGPVRGLNPEDFHKLITKIIDSGKDESGIPKLKESLVVAALRKDREDQASASPATTISSSSIKPVTKENGGVSRS